MLKKKLVSFLLIAFLFSLLPSIGLAKTNPPESEYIGYHDNTSCDVITGWAKKRDSIENVEIAVILDFPFGRVEDKEFEITKVINKEVGRFKADLFRPDLPYEDKNHGFSWKMPDSLKDMYHEFYVYSIGNDGKPEMLLNRSGQGVYCGPERVVHPIGTLLEVTKGGLEVRAGAGLEHRKLRCWAPGYCYGTRKLPKSSIITVKDVVLDKDGDSWYKIDPGIHWKVDVPWWLDQSDWFIEANPAEVRKVLLENEITVFPETKTSDKKIVIDLSEKKEYVYEGDRLLFITCIATGLNGTPTPLGSQKIYRKWASRYMQCQGDCDLPGVGFNLYFGVQTEYSKGGQAVHEAYWRKTNEFCSQRSHGCANNMIGIGRWLYQWVGPWDNTKPTEFTVTVQR